MNLTTESQTHKLKTSKTDNSIAAGLNVLSSAMNKVSG